jgi:hypothetical protein
MPIIDFPYYLDSLTLEAIIRGTGRVLAYEEVDGINASDGEVRARVYGLGTVYNNINIDGTSYTGALISATSALTNIADPIVSIALGAAIEASSRLEGTLSYGEGRASLPALVSFGSDRALISGLTYLPSLYANADSGWYIPPELVGGYALLVGLSSSGLIKQPDLGEGYIDALVSQGWLYTEDKDEVFTQPFYMETKIQGRGAVASEEQIDGHYAYDFFATIAARSAIYNNITIDGVTYTGATAAGTGTVTGDATYAGALKATIATTGTFNPSNDIGQYNPFTTAMYGYGRIPPLRSWGNDGIRTEATFDSFLLGTPLVYVDFDIVVTFSSDLTVSSIFIVRRDYINTLLETLSATSIVNPLGSYQLTKVEAIALTDFFSAAVDGIPGAFSSNTTTWVLNVDTGATVQYDRFGFNSFAERDGQYLAAAEDGIYLLEGTTDAGVEIQSLVDLAISRFATPQKKYFPTVYIGVTSTGKMLLKANVDGTDWIFEANNTATTMQNQRIDLGRGLSGSHWRFTILNQDGVDFDLESVEFLPLISSRRVY